MTPAGSGPEVASGNVGHNCRQQLPSVAAVAASSSAQLAPAAACAVTAATGGQVELLNHHLVQVSEIKSYYWTADTYYIVIVELFSFDINDTLINSQYLNLG